jgi:DNA repair protein RadC
MLPSLIQNQDGLFETTGGPVTFKEIILGVQEAMATKFNAKLKISNPSDARDYFYTNLVNEEQEIFSVMFLDNQHRFISYERLFFGTINASQVHPRIVVKRALELNAAAVLIGHCHPSGVSGPSLSDVDITATLKKALNLIDVRLLDHLIICGSGVTSLAERGQL